MKKTLPVRPFLTSRVISARANSTSARTSVDICAVASLTSSPIDGSADSACGSVNGMLVSVRGTPSLRSVFVRSDLLTDGPPELGPIVRFMLPCSPMPDEATEHCQPCWDRRWWALITLDWRGRFRVSVHCSRREYRFADHVPSAASAHGGFGGSLQRRAGRTAW